MDEEEKYPQIQFHLKYVCFKKMQLNFDSYAKNIEELEEIINNYK